MLRKPIYGAGNMLKKAKVSFFRNIYSMRKRFFVPWKHNMQYAQYKFEMRCRA